MRHRTTLPALLLSAAALVATPASARTLPWASVATIPSSPAPGDDVVLSLSGEWPDACVPTAARTSLTQDGSRLHVHLGYGPLDVACASVVSPWELQVEAGPLAAGTYTVEVTRARVLMPAETIGRGTFVVAAPETSRFWIPAFSATSDGYDLASNLTAFNNGDRGGSVAALAAYDALGERDPGRPPVAIAPDHAATVPTTGLRAGQAVEMLELSAPARFALRATLERLESVPEGAPKVPESYGRVELPVFTSLFPAGQTAVAGDVSLTPTECAGPVEARRRVNLTILNAGDAAGSFVVVGATVAPGPGGNEPPQTYAVPARSLVQFNGLSVTAFPVCEPGGAWFRITGDQPFLAYVSTARPQTVPGILPYEVFPARLDR